MFAVPNNEKCPVKAKSTDKEKQPAEMKIDNAPIWLRQTLIQKVTKLKSLKKRMVQKAGLGKTTAAEKL